MSDYVFYFPDLIEEWKAGHYESVAKTLLQKDNVSVTVFCLDLYYLKIGRAEDRLARLALEVSKLEGIELDNLSLGDIEKLSECIGEWQEDVGVSREREHIVAKLLDYPICCLISFASSAILLSSSVDEPTKPLHMGILGGLLARLGDYE